MEADRRQRFGSIRGDTTRIATDRATALRLAVDNASEKCGSLHGTNKTPRKVQLDFGMTKPVAVAGDAVPVWIQDEWSTSEKAVRSEARAEGADSPLVFVLLPRQQPEALTNGLAEVAAASAVLAARPAQQKTPEGMEARRAMETRRASAEGQVADIVADILANARVFQSGGNEVVGSTLTEAVQAAAQAALARLFQEFSVTDVAGWSQVVARASKGDPNALEAAGYTGEADKHPAAGTLLTTVGSSGKKGSEVRSQFMGAGYGWPQDAVDGLLLALLNGGSLSATDKAGPAGDRQAAYAIADWRGDLRREGGAGDAPEGLRTGPDDGTGAGGRGSRCDPAGAAEVERELAAEVSGPPPLPAKPDTGYIQALRAYSGNERLVHVYEARERLSADYEAWKVLRDRKPTRQERWRMLQDLLKHATQLPLTEAIQARVDAIVAQRLLLDAVDPVKPLLDTLTGCPPRGPAARPRAGRGYERDGVGRHPRDR